MSENKYIVPNKPLPSPIQKRQLNQSLPTTSTPPSMAQLQLQPQQSSNPFQSSPAILAQGPIGEAPPIPNRPHLNPQAFQPPPQNGMPQYFNPPPIPNRPHSPNPLSPRANNSPNASMGGMTVQKTLTPPPMPTQPYSPPVSPMGNGLSPFQSSPSILQGAAIANYNSNNNYNNNNNNNNNALPRNENTNNQSKNTPPVSAMSGSKAGMGVSEDSKPNEIKGTLMVVKLQPKKRFAALRQPIAHPRFCHLQNQFLTFSEKVRIISHIQLPDYYITN